MLVLNYCKDSDVVYKQTNDALREEGALLLNFDIADFDEYTQKKGHVAANAILKDVSNFFTDLTDEHDITGIFFRIGTHTFAGIFPKTSKNLRFQGIQMISDILFWKSQIE